MSLVVWLSSVIIIYSLLLVYLPAVIFFCTCLCVRQAITERLQRGRVHVTASRDGVRGQRSGAAKSSNQLQQPAILAVPAPAGQVQPHPGLRESHRVVTPPGPAGRDHQLPDLAWLGPASQSARPGRPAFHSDTGQRPPVAVC